MVTKQFSKRVVVPLNTMGSVLVRTVLLDWKPVLPHSKGSSGAVLNHGNKRKMQMPWKRVGPLKPSMRLGRDCPSNRCCCRTQLPLQQISPFSGALVCTDSSGITESSGGKHVILFFIYLFRGAATFKLFITANWNGSASVVRGLYAIDIFLLCPIKRSLQCSWLCRQDSGSECWTARQWRSTCSIRRVISQARENVFSWPLAFEPLFTFNFSLRRELRCPRQPLHLVFN